IELKFKKEHSTYECGNDVLNDESMASIDAPKEEEWDEGDWGSFYSGYWNEGYEYEDYYYEGYDYSQRENPCNVSYYSGKGASQNVLASDLGIIAKAGTDRQLHVVVSDIKNTNPMGGVQLEYYDFQQQKIGTATTDGEGMAVTKLKTKPFIVIAKKGKQRGYLTLRDGEALSVSKFDVSGATTVKGVKGFPYTERGVYRPGDSIYLSFMLEDKEKVLPLNHPVVMEMRNPSGVVVQKIVRSKNVNGLYDFRTATLPDDPTGYWSTRFLVGNREFYQNIRVETIKPNRLKLYLDFGGKDKLSALDEVTTGKVSAKWLHGAPARNMNTMVEMTLNGGYTQFDNYKDYVFDNPTRSFTSQQMVLFDGQLDDNGEATFDVKINAGQNAPGMLKAFFTTRVFEKGGDFSIDQSSLAYSPYTHYVGIKVPEGEGWNNTLVTDKDHVLNFATVDANGKPASRKLDVKIYKVENHWWWDSYNNNDMMAFITNNGIVPHQQGTVTTSNGKGIFKFRVNKPTWGSFLILVRDVESNHMTGSQVYVDWPNGSRDTEASKENATMLTFSTDKKTYQVGEEVTVTIPSPAEGRALLSVESGTRVIEKSWVETKKGETKYTFKTTEEMSPTAYVNITLVQPHAQVKNDLPIRLYGIVPINVENKDSHLTPVIACPKEFKPESTPTINVSEKDGKAMTYTLAIVDEGLLDLTNFKTPDPWNNFYSRDALGVKTWDVYDNVLGSYAIKMDELLAIGGDAESDKDGESESKANRFKPMVYFAGPFALEAGGKAAHKVKIPNYVGSVRVMVVAGENRSYGCAEKTVPVRAPLMVLATLPRVLGPGEEVELPVNVFAMEKHVKNVNIEVKSNDMFTFKNGKTKSLNFAKPGDEVVNFPAIVANRLGVGKVTVIVKSGKETAKHEIEIQVRSSNPKIMDAYETVLDPGKQWNTSLAFNGLKGSNFASIEVSTIPPVNLGERLKYLIEYPHGCIEQTTSAAFPQLYLSKIMDLDANFKKEIKKNIQATIKRIGLFQTSNGGFAYWPGQTDANGWGTTYATHFLLEAEAAGYKVSSSVKNSALDYLKNKARYFRLPSPNVNTNTAYSYDYGAYYSTDTYDQAYRLFVLALAKQADLGAMNRLREYAKISVEEKWRLAAAYQLAGQANVAKEITSGLSTKIPPYANPGYTFGSDVRDRAMILETMVLMKNKIAAAQLARELSRELNADNWMSTQTTAYCLLAMSKFAGIAGSSREINFNYTLNGKLVNKNVRNVMYQEKIDGNKLAANSKVSVKNAGKGLLYVRVVVEKVPMAGDSITAVNNNIKLGISYTDMDGQPIKVEEIEQGTDFIAEVSINNPGSRGYLTEMALNQIFPSGWEIHNTRMDNFDAALQTDIVTYQDYRDDRVYSYYNIGESSNKTIRIRLNAAYVGKYYLPTATTEAMYDNSIYARVPGRWVNVIPASKKGDLAQK
ncbi:MAG TPA: MG2 domain-containing protein, partial [Flavobacteriales bacterium]|nr:MG2 domain-containing protein [Flavobacteriales bacterium]